MELRIAHARATKDIDLTYINRFKNETELLSDLILKDLESLAIVDLGDYFVYQVGKAQIDLENAPYGGARYPVAAFIDGKIFVRFQLDVGADFLQGTVENIQGTYWLEFCGISAPLIPMICIEQQFAEKLHAYTLPREERINSRAKDLVDMVLLLNIKTPQPNEMIPVLQQVFKKRNTHPLPEKLEEPPTAWKSPFIAMASECGIPQDMQTSFTRISEFYDSMCLNLPLT